MKAWIWLTCLIVFTVGAEHSILDIFKYIINPGAHTNLTPKITTADRIAAHGYPVETHETRTEDGYIITLFRIPYSHKLQNQNKSRPIVLIQHGLFCSSDFWMVNGPNDGIGFNLADAGYDVWFGNARGNTYGRNHISRLVSQRNFWHFSWHEIGKYDIKAMIDYALKANGQGQQALHYVGHSQGTTSFFILMSTRPEYNAKIKTAHMLAPVAFMNNMLDKLSRELGPILGHYNEISRSFMDREFLPSSELYAKLSYTACEKNSPFKKFCNSLSFMVENLGANTNITAVHMMTESLPAGVSTNQVCHYLQEQQSASFCQYDYGKLKNLVLYGQAQPPVYPVELITSKVHLWYGDNDSQAAVKDVERLAEKLPNKVKHHMREPTWCHMDPVMNNDVKKLVNEPIIDIMENYEKQ